MPSLKPSSFLILGLVRGGFTSGYAIRSAIEGMRTGAFWATGFAQIYPELARLERDGYIVRRDDPRGARRRSAYSLSPAGEEAFVGWMTSAAVPPMELRDEGLLRLGFGDHLADEEALAMVGRLRERAKREERAFRESLMPMAAAVGEQGWRFPLIVARMGAEYHGWAAGFFASVEDELSQSRPRRGRGAREQRHDPRS